MSKAAHDAEVAKAAEAKAKEEATEAAAAAEVDAERQKKVDAKIKEAQVRATTHVCKFCGASQPALVTQLWLLAAHKRFSRAALISWQAMVESSAAKKAEEAHAAELAKAAAAAKDLEEAEVSATACSRTYAMLCYAMLCYVGRACSRAPDRWRTLAQMTPPAPQARNKRCAAAAQKHIDEEKAKKVRLGRAPRRESTA